MIDHLHDHAYNAEAFVFALALSVSNQKTSCFNTPLGEGSQKLHYRFTCIRCFL